MPGATGRLDAALDRSCTALLIVAGALELVALLLAIGTGPVPDGTQYAERLPTRQVAAFDASRYTVPAGRDASRDGEARADARRAQPRSQ